MTLSAGKWLYRWIALGWLSLQALGCAGAEQSTPGPMPRHRSERRAGTQLAMVSPSGMAMRAVPRGAVRVDAFESLLGYAGLDDWGEFPSRDEALSSEEAARLLSVLLRKPVTLANFPPRMAASHLLREVLQGEAVSRQEVLRRVERFSWVAVLRPDGYLAWALDGRTQQKVGPVGWEDGAFRARGFELGRFYTSQRGVFRLADAWMQWVRELAASTSCLPQMEEVARASPGVRQEPRQPREAPMEPERARSSLPAARGRLMPRTLRGMAASTSASSVESKWFPAKRASAG